MSEAPVHAPLQRVVGGTAGAGADRSWSKIGMQAQQPARLLRVDVIARGQLVTFRANIGDIEQRLARQLPLKSERPALCVRIQKILLQRAVLRIQQAGWA